MSNDRSAPEAAAAAPGPAAPDYHESSLWRWRGPSSLVGGVLFALLGLLFIAGILAYGGDDALENARPTDLVQILDSLETENDRLEQEQRRLQSELTVLTSGESAAALAQAQDRLASLEILAGTTAVRGPGVRVDIRDVDGGIEAADLLDAVQELRDAGAESIEISGQRVVVNTWFADPGESGGVLVSGTLVSSPYTILAIGDAETLATALQIPGGVADSARTAGADVAIDQRDSLDITATVPLIVPEYAEPVDAQ